MIYAGIAAGGTGTRMGSEIPKQFLEIGGMPIILRTVQRFLSVGEIDIVYIAVHPDWVVYTSELVNDLAKSGRIRIIAGGEDRNSTVIKITDDISECFGISEEDMILTHDAVRPFVSEKVIRDNIICTKKHDACTTAVSAVDTILQSSSGEMVSSSPPRDQMFHAQTPQSFKISRLREVYYALSEEKKASLTDTCSVFTVSGLPVHIVEGNRENIKITTPLDMKLAQALI